ATGGRCRQDRDCTRPSATRTRDRMDGGHGRDALGLARDVASSRVVGRAPVEFRVLGRLEVTVGSNPIELRGSKRRALVALLLVERGRVGPADRVVRHVWGDDPHAVTRVKGAVHEVRRLLGAGGGRLVTAPGGYSLDVGANELDASVFEDRVAQAGAAVDR